MLDNLVYLQDIIIERYIFIMLVDISSSELWYILHVGKANSVFL